MKRYLKIGILFVLMISLNGCRNRNISDEVYEDCKSAINIVDDFLNKYISYEKAYDMLDNIECNDRDEYDDDFSVCLDISGLKTDFLLYDSPYSSKVITTNDFRESRDELARKCGI